MSWEGQRQIPFLSSSWRRRILSINGKRSLRTIRACSVKVTPKVWPLLRSYGTILNSCLCWPRHREFFGVKGQVSQIQRTLSGRQNSIFFFQSQLLTTIDYMWETCLFLTLLMLWAPTLNHSIVAHDGDLRKTTTMHWKRKEKMFFYLRDVVGIR